MANRTVWIVGGLVVAIGAVVYVTYKEGPANTSATGTVVEAKRALSDGATSSAPATPGDRSADRSADNTAATDDAQAERARSQVDNGGKAQMQVDNGGKAQMQVDNGGKAQMQVDNGGKAQMQVDNGGKAQMQLDNAAGTQRPK
jgi:hypothetical protein